MQKSYILKDIYATHAIAQKVATSIVPNFVITLTGNLGAGKTTFTREVLRALGVNGIIKSPTFTLVEPYQVNQLQILHFDLYRFNDPEEWFDAGFDEYFQDEPICFIEWAEKANALIPKIDWAISIEIIANDMRKLTVTALSNIGEECLKNLTINDEI